MALLHWLGITIYESDQQISLVSLAFAGLLRSIYDGFK
jgi:hypothetical protein